MLNASMSSIDVPLRNGGFGSASRSYPANNNNGKIASQTDHAVGGETVAYAYDAESFANRWGDERLVGPELRVLRLREFDGSKCDCGLGARVIVARTIQC